MGEGQLDLLIGVVVFLHKLYNALVNLILVHVFNYHFRSNTQTCFLRVSYLAFVVIHLHRSTLSHFPVELVTYCCNNFVHVP